MDSKRIRSYDKELRLKARGTANAVLLYETRIITSYIYKSVVILHLPHTARMERVRGV